MKTIKIVDFTEYPGLRHNAISEDSGEEYYHKVLNEEFKTAYANKEELVVNLDDTAGFAPSFLDEAFGNLVYDFGKDIVQKHLKIVSKQEKHLVDFIENETYSDWEIRRTKNNKPKTTAEHPKWWAIEEGELIKVRR